MSNELYSVREASKRCNVPYRTVYQWIGRGLLAVTTKPLRISIAQVEAAKLVAKQHRSDVQIEAQNRGKV